MTTTQRQKAIEAAEKAYRDHIEHRPMVNAIAAYESSLSQECGSGSVKSEAERHCAGASASVRFCPAKDGDACIPSSAPHPNMGDASTRKDEEPSNKSEGARSSPPPKQVDDCREAFVKKAASDGWNMNSYGGDGYTSKITNRLWKYWQAAWNHPAMNPESVEELIEKLEGNIQTAYLGGQIYEWMCDYNKGIKDCIVIIRQHFAQSTAPKQVDDCRESFERWYAKEIFFNHPDRKLGQSYAEAMWIGFQAAWNHPARSSEVNVAMPTEFGGASSAELFKELGASQEQAETMEREWMNYEQDAKGKSDG